MPSVKKYAAVLEGGSADQNLLISFKAQFSELKKVITYSLWQHTVPSLFARHAAQIYPFCLDAKFSACAP